MTNEKKPLPKHIAIIMDGNGRWAKQKLMNRVKGHEKGAKAVRTTVTACRELGVEALSLYAFSMENWQRPKAEVAALMRLLERYLIDERAEILDNDIRLVASGRLAMLPDFVREKLFSLMEASKKNQGMTLNLCLSYGGKEEIADAAKAIAADALSGAIKTEDITPELFERYLYRSELPPVDLMIRTSGELRTSGFLPWQIAYAEFAFIDAYWPDFTKETLMNAIEAYRSRERRYGKIKE